MTPFVIVGMPRTGSTLLQMGLAQHPEVRAFGELLHPVDAERLGPHALVRDGATVAYEDKTEDAIEFLKREVFDREWTETRAIGFKLFGEYVKGPGTEQLFVRLKESLPGLKVIHIVRPNYLDALVSQEIAKRTKSWVKLADDGASRSPTERIRVDPLEALQFFATYARTDRFLTQHFAGDAYLRVHYGSLSHDFSHEMNRVFQHLQVAAFEPRQSVKKQVTEPASALIENFGELRQHFRGTAYETLFGAGYAPIEFLSDTEMNIGEYRFDLDSSGAVRDKFSSDKSFVLMKPPRLIELYRHLFDEIAPANILELGIRRGGSMAYYNLAFRPRRHVGIELETDTIAALSPIAAWAESEERRMVPYFGVDQADSAALAGIIAQEFEEAARPLDLVIDDASHRNDASQKSFEALFPRLRTGGVYCVEDWGWAHWPPFQGPNAYFSSEPALTNLIFKLIILHTCRPDIISEVRITPGVAIYRRGSADLAWQTFKIDDHLVLRGRELPLI